MCSAEKKRELPQNESSYFIIILTQLKFKRLELSRPYLKKFPPPFTSNHRKGKITYIKVLTYILCFAHFMPKQQTYSSIKMAFGASHNIIALRAFCGCAAALIFQRKQTRDFNLIKVKVRIRNVNSHMKSQFNVLQSPHSFLPAGYTFAILALTGMLSVSRPGF